MPLLVLYQNYVNVLKMKGDSPGQGILSRYDASQTLMRKPYSLTGACKVTTVFWYSFLCLRTTCFQQDLIEGRIKYHYTVYKNFVKKKYYFVESPPYLLWRRT